MFEYSEDDLVQAVEMNRPEPLQLFISQNPQAADILDRVRDKNGRSLLLLAAFEGSGDVLPVLLQCPRILGKLNSRDSTQRTALHFAAAIGDEACVRSLIVAGAMVDPEDEFRCTPLHLAVKFEQLVTASVLLELGADALKKDLKGDNAIDMARSAQDDKVFATRESTCHVQESELYALLMALEPQKRPSAWKRLLPSWSSQKNQRYACENESEAVQDDDGEHLEASNLPHRASNAERLPQGCRAGGA